MSSLNRRVSVSSISHLNKELKMFFFFTKINDIHSFKLIEYIDTMQIR